MKNAKSLCLTLATAAALTFAAAPMTSAFAASDTNNIQCFGINGCKGQSDCKTANSGCKGQNSCKGKGFKMTATKEDCTKAGGKTTEAYE